MTVGRKQKSHRAIKRVALECVGALSPHKYTVSLIFDNCKSFLNICCPLGTSQSIPNLLISSTFASVTISLTFCGSSGNRWLRHTDAPVARLRAAVCNAAL